MGVFRSFESSIVLQFLVCSTKNDLNESALRISLPGIIHALHQRVANDSRTRFSRVV